MRRIITEGKPRQCALAIHARSRPEGRYTQNWRKLKSNKRSPMLEMSKTTDKTAGQVKYSRFHSQFLLIFLWKFHAVVIFELRRPKEPRNSATCKCYTNNAPILFSPSLLIIPSHAIRQTNNPKIMVQQYIAT
jgi:hypothetical protein